METSEWLVQALACALRFASRMNRITVVGDDSIDAQARTYAEYRVFGVLVRHTRRAGQVRVVLRYAGNRSAGNRANCVVTVPLEPAGSLRIRSTGAHVYAAINRAVERLGKALGRRVEQQLSS